MNEKRRTGLQDKSPRPHDRKVDEAKHDIMSQILSDGKEVYYGRQIERLFENTYFHWITKSALNELAKEGQIGFQSGQLEHHNAHFYYPRRHRYPKRQIQDILELISEFSEPKFTKAVGHHGELLVEAAFARIGFRIKQQGVTTVDGKTWDASGHDLDFLVERNGIRYGVEVKNQLGYIDQTEFQIKLQMCEHFGLRPFFVTRMIPKTYINTIIEKGGYAFITANQNYPLLAEDLAKRVVGPLRLPVAVIERLPDTALTRFERWHEKQHSV